MANMRDVAREADVSISSVSAVVTGKTGEVSPETQCRILAAIEKIGYKPNHTARQLKTGTFNTIALMYSHPTSLALLTQGFVMFLAGVSSAAADAHLDLLLPTAAGMQDLVQVIDNLVSRGVDGAIVLGPISLKKEILEAIESCTVPIVCLDSYRGFSKASCLESDNVAGMRMAVEHLIASGHRRIVYIGHPPVYQCFMDRMQAFCNVMLENGFPIDETSVRIIDEEHVDSCITEIISRPNRPTAIIVGQQNQGISAWNALAAAGLKMPEDIALAVYDRLPENHPGYNTVMQISNQQLYEQGKAAMELLVSIISGKTTPPVNIRFRPEMIIPCPLPKLQQGP